MKRVERSEVLGLADYETIRDHFRARVIEEKKLRRVALGPMASCVFENRDTVLLQIQEMLRTERITREGAVLHEIETYNEFIPGDHELSATVLFEIDDKGIRDSFLVEAIGLERAFSLVVDGVECKGKNDESRVSEGRTTAVHYLKFVLSETAERALRVVLADPTQLSPIVELVVAHPRYSARTTLGAAMVKSLAEDLV